MQKGTAFIISAPAGTGKTTLVKKLTKEFPTLVKSVTYTTRSPRKVEEPGKDYYFLSYQEFERKVNQKHFLEYAEVFGHFYGTDKETIAKLLDQGLDVILVIDTQGALEIKSFFNGVYVFLAPPSFEELKNRLVKRATESPDELEKRLSWAKHELEQAPHYDYCIINDDLKKSYDQLRAVYIAERLKKQTKRFPLGENQ